MNAGDRGFDPAGFPDSLVATDVPGTFLVARGFSPLIAEEQLNEVFRQYAQVKTVVLIRDPATNFSRGLAYIEFHSIDHATYALQNTNNMLLGGGDVSIASSSAALKVAFARESTMRQLIQKVNLPLMMMMGMMMMMIMTGMMMMIVMSKLIVMMMIVMSKLSHR